MNRFAQSIILAVTLCIAGTSVAQAQVETVVVTGSRVPEEAVGIFIIKRADHVITSVVVTCDTRDPAQRREELKATLRGMLHAAAGTSTISLGVGDKTVDKLTEADFDDIIGTDSRPDTSRAVIIVKSTVSATDTLNAIVARATAFILKTAKVGRTEVYRQGDWDLTLIAPEQYREPILAKVVDDAKRASALFGAGYGISMEGLEHQVSWYQKGPLDLALYIPYAMKITPLAH
jgi:hypothetical protein